MTSELRPAAWMYRRMTTAEDDRVEFTRTPWAYVLTGYTETPLYTREAVRAEQAAEIERLRALLDERISVYEQKRDKADPLADETYNRHEAITYVLEALEIVKLGIAKFGGRDAA